MHEVGLWLSGGHCSCDDADYSPVNIETLCQHSPVITSSIRRIHAQTQLFPKWTLKSGKCKEDILCFHVLHHSTRYADLQIWFHINSIQTCLRDPQNILINQICVKTQDITFNFTREIYQLINILYIMTLCTYKISQCSNNIQGVPGGMWNTSGECSLC